MFTMNEKQLTCIQCPRGCQLSVCVQSQKVVSVTGMGCKRGELYAHDEIIHPKRTVTSTVAITQGDHDRVSVKTARPVPKEFIFDVMTCINTTCVIAPVHVGDVLIENICGTGISLVATSHVEKHLSD